MPQVEPLTSTPAAAPRTGPPRPAARLRSRLLRSLAANPWGLLAIPALAFLAVFFLYPVGDMLYRSFTEFIPPEVGGFSNYRWFFGTAVNVTILIRTFQTAAIVTVVCVLLAFPYAYLMTCVGPRWRLVMLAAVLVPFWTSLMVRNYAWIVLLQDSGPVNSLLSSLGVGRIHMIGTLLGVTIGMCQVLLPFMVLPLYATLRGIDARLLQAAQGLGAPPHVAFLKVYVPLSLPGLLAGSLLVFVLALGFYITPALLGSPTNALISQVMVTQVSSLLAFGRGGAMAVVLLVLTLLLLGASAMFARRSQAYADPGGKQ